MATVNFVPYEIQNITYLKNTLDYVQREDKTVMEDGKQLVTGLNCTPQMAFHEFVSTRKAFNKESPVWFFHYDQSFHPTENITPEKAHALAVEFAQKAWPKSEVVVATHLDVEHTHSHFVVNAVLHESGYMLRQPPGTLKRLRDLSDELCLKYGLSVLPPNKHSDSKVKGMSTREYRSAEKGQSWKMQMASTIDLCMRRSRSKEEFIRNMEKRKYQVRWEDDRQNITYTHPNGKKARDFKLHERKYLKEVMEREFRIRQQVIYGRIEEAQPGGTAAGRDTDTARSTAPAAADLDSVRHPGNGEQVGIASAQTGGTGCGADFAAEETLRYAQLASHQDADGRTDAGGDGAEADDRTGWEEERAALFAAEVQNPTAAAAHERPGTGYTVDGIGGVASDLVGLGRRLEQSQSAVINDSTTMHRHTDSKAYRKTQQKKIAQGHKKDDHEEEHIWQQTM